ncbi:MAG: iron ABC transporter permease [Pseudomonadota bacterium]
MREASASAKPSSTDTSASKARVALLVAVAIAAGICLLPILAVFFAATTSGTETLLHLAETRLSRFIGNTLILVGAVAIGTALIGTGAAWLVTMTRFPGVRFFEVALILPLAFPAYVLAYAYTDFLDHPGLVQTTLRDVMGWGPRDYWFPEIRSVGGAAAMLTLVLYPYVYLLARGAFLQQSGALLLTARTLGHGSVSAFLRVALPMARPAIAGGVLLAVMETIADFGTVSYFGVPTFATGIYQSWFSMSDRGAAAQLAFCLLSFALFIALLERSQRGAARHHDKTGRFSDAPAVELHGARAIVAAAFCALPVLLGFVLPVVLLFSMGIGSEQNLLSDRYLGFIQNSLILASVAAVATVVAAVVLSFAVRLLRTPAVRAAREIARIGYAVPGGVIAVGLLVPFAALDNSIDRMAETLLGVSTGLLITGSISVLVAAYMVRFMAAALNTVDSGFATIDPKMDAVARTLGHSPWDILRTVHVPILAPSLLTALLIVFIDVLKELPATLIMRPFNFDTLAVQAHRLASDERLAGAAVPSLVIVALGLLPVILVCRSVRRQRYRSN